MSQQARLIYTATVSRPKLNFGFEVASQVLEPDDAAIRDLNKCIQNAKTNLDFNLKFVYIGIESARVAVFFDASFASSRDSSSQLGFVIVLADRNGSTNVLHYSSFKSKRVTKSALTVKLFAAVLPFDFASTLHRSINDIFARAVSLILFANSKFLWIALWVSIQPAKNVC